MTVQSTMLSLPLKLVLDYGLTTAIDFGLITEILELYVRKIHLPDLFILIKHIAIPP
jgi:hypothetical protein